MKGAARLYSYSSEPILKQEQHWRRGICKVFPKRKNNTIPVYVWEQGASAASHPRPGLPKFIAYSRSICAYAMIFGWDIDIVEPHDQPVTGAVYNSISTGCEHCSTIRLESLQLQTISQAIGQLLEMMR